MQKSPLSPENYLAKEEAAPFIYADKLGSYIYN